MQRIGLAVTLRASSLAQFTAVGQNDERGRRATFGHHRHAEKRQALPPQKDGVR